MCFAERVGETYRQGRVESSVTLDPLTKEELNRMTCSTQLRDQRISISARPFRALRSWETKPVSAPPFSKRSSVASLR